MIIDSTLPAFKLKELIEKTGRQAVLTGFGITNTGNVSFSLPFFS